MSQDAAVTTILVIAGLIIAWGGVSMLRKKKEFPPDEIDRAEAIMKEEDEREGRGGPPYSDGGPPVAPAV